MIYRVSITKVVEVELKMTYKGRPMRMPDMNQPGEPPEAPEYEMESIHVPPLTDAEKDEAIDLAIDMANPEDFDEGYAD